jgi:hypothetical protein
MTFEERQKLVRRITSGKLYGIMNHNNEEHYVVFTDPVLSFLTEADFVYTKVYKNLVSNKDVMTLESSYKLLREKGIWTDQMQQDLVSLESDLEKLQAKVIQLKFQKAHQKSIKNLIKQTKEKIIELARVRDQLWESTAEFFAERHKTRFLMKKIVQVENQQLLEDPNFLDILSVYYYKENFVEEAKTREIARTDPWRLYWIVSKDTGTHLFPHSCVEMTDLQYALVSWSRVYDFAFSSSNRPSDDIVEDDDAFMAWYRAEVKRISSESQRQALEQSLGSGFGSQEVFVPADSEGAKEVYDLNDPIGRSRIKERQKALLIKGQLHQAELPDVKRDINMELNRLASENTKNRSR